MTNFEILLNGVKICQAGIDSDGVLSSIVTRVKEPENKDEAIFLAVSALNAQTKDNHRWVSHTLSHNDEVTIRIVNSGTPDPPIIVSKEEVKKGEIETKLEAYNRLKEELKDYL